MGVDCPDVCQILRLGPPEDTESYIQEIDRAGQDGEHVVTVVMIVKGIRTLAHVRTLQWLIALLKRSHSYNCYLNVQHAFTFAAHAQI